MQVRINTTDFKLTEELSKIHDVLEWAATALRIPTYPCSSMGGFVPKGFTSGCVFMNEAVDCIDIEVGGNAINGLYLAHNSVIQDLLSEDVEISVDRRVIIEDCKVECVVRDGGDWRNFRFIGEHAKYMGLVTGLHGGVFIEKEAAEAKLDRIYGVDSVISLLVGSLAYTLTLSNSSGVLGSYLVIGFDTTDECDALLHYLMMCETWALGGLPAHMRLIDTYSMVRIVRDEYNLLTSFVESGEMSSEFLATVMANIWLKRLTAKNDSPIIATWRQISYYFEPSSHSIFGTFKECVSGDVEYVSEVASTISIKIIGVQVTTLAGVAIRMTQDKRAYLTTDFKQLLSAFIASHILPFVVSGLNTVAAANVPWTSLHDCTVDEFLTTHLALVALDQESGLMEAVYQLTSQEKTLVLSAIKAEDLARMMPYSNSVH